MESELLDKLRPLATHQMEERQEKGKEEQLEAKEVHFQETLEILETQVQQDKPLTKEDLHTTEGHQMDMKAGMEEKDGIVEMGGMAITAGMVIMETMATTDGMAKMVGTEIMEIMGGMGTMATMGGTEIMVTTG